MIKFIKALSGQFIIVDAEDFERASEFNWSIGQNGYPKRQFRLPNGKNTAEYLHRFILMPKKGEHVDHADGDKTDASKSNIRICNRSQNQRNRRQKINCDNPYKGIHLLRRTGRWQAQITIAFRKKKHLGYFATAEEAARAYDEGARKYHGEFARPNFP